MVTALLAAKNILGANHDLWQVNTEPEYQEEIKVPAYAEFPYSIRALAATQPAVPERIRALAVTPTVEYES